jgi:hypothetical protein
LVEITCIIPTTGERETLEQAVDSASGADRVQITTDVERLGAYGHVIRNRTIDLLRNCGVTGYFCTLDDDDVYTPEAFSVMRVALASFPYSWFIFQMVGGKNSHFPDIVVPTMGHQILKGNVGTPMLLWPAYARSRFGTEFRGGYFGDFEMAARLNEELGPPVWIESVVAEIRP